ncbi:retrotransposon protein, putative, ty1-copia subclass [Tanacetum coccineum]
MKILKDIECGPYSEKPPICLNFQKTRRAEKVKQIKVVRSDRGGEYVSPFADLCAKHGSDTSSLLPIHLSKTIPLKEKEETPYELWMGRKPSYQSLRVWGCLAKVVVPTPKAQKIGPNSVDYIFIGYAKNNKASSRLDDEVVQDKRQRDDNDLHDERQDQLEDEEVEPRRSKKARTEKSFGPDFVSLMLENEPTSYREAVTSLEGHQWKEAIKSEINSILQNHTWELMDLPPSCKLLGYKLCFN